MEKIWANRLTAEPPTKTWNDVPNSRKAGVKAELGRRVEANEITAERYEAITGEKYAA